MTATFFPVDICICIEFEHQLLNNKKSFIKLLYNPYTESIGE